MEAIKDMRAECVRHYVDRGYSPEWAERVIHANRKLISSIYNIIQAEQQGSIPPYPPIESDEETAAYSAAVSLYQRGKARRSKNSWAKQDF